jgi:hypothetical protein
MQNFSIETARWEDIDELVLLEKQVWLRRGTPVLTRKDIAKWLADSSPFFLVARDEAGKICGYYYGKQVQFDVSTAEEFLAEDKVTGMGYSDHSHDPLADSVYGVSVASKVPGAGMALNREVRKLLVKLKIRYFLGFSRLSKLKKYMEKLKSKSLDKFVTDDEIALWYSYSSARLLRMRIWRQMELMPLIPLVRPDPVLAFHAKDTNLGFYGILPGYMPDPSSCDYGAFIFSEIPHF